MNLSMEALRLAVQDACRAGIESESERWRAKLLDLICGSHYARGCKHSECYTLENILEEMNPVSCAACQGEGVIDEGDVDGQATVSKCACRG